MSPEEQLRRLRDADRWHDTTLAPLSPIPRAVSERRPPVRRAWMRPLGAAAAVVVVAGLFFGVGRLAQTGSAASSAYGSADRAATSSAAASAASGTAASDSTASLTAPVPFAAIAAGGAAAGSTTSQTAAGDAGPLRALSASIEVPPQVRAGTTLEFVVTLKNPSSRAVPFAGCPDYVETVVVGSARLTRHYGLNCTPVGAEPTTHSVSFAMRIPLPAGALGAATVSWELDGVPRATATTEVIAG